MCFGIFGEREVVPGIGLAQGDIFCALRELSQAELANGFEHHEAALIAAPAYYEALIDQAADAIQDIDAQPLEVVRAAYDLGGLQGPTTSKDREALEEQLLILAQQIITPIDQIIQSLLASGQVSRTAG